MPRSGARAGRTRTTAGVSVLRRRDDAAGFARLPEQDETPPARNLRTGGARGVNGNSPATTHRRSSRTAGRQPAATSPRIPSFPRPQIKKRMTDMTTYIEQKERSMRDKRADAERERASRTIIDALDVVKGTSAARDARYAYTTRRSCQSGGVNGGQADAAISSLCFRCVAQAGVTRNLETSVKSAVLHTFQPDEVIEVFELRRTTGGQPRARTGCGWVSVISQSGKRLLEQLKEDRVSARVNGPRQDDSDASHDQSGSPRTLGKADMHLSLDGEDDSMSEAGTFDGSEYWSAEEDLEGDLRALELDETHLAARWGAETAAEGAPVGTRHSPTKANDGSGDDDKVIELSGDGHPISKEHPRITDQHMKHNHKFAWEKTLAAYLSRMVIEGIDEDFNITLKDNVDVDENGNSVLEFKVDIAVPRILRWIAGRSTCVLLERCTVDWEKRQFTVESQTQNWTDKFSVTESSVYAAQPVGDEERTDFYKVLHIEQFMAFPPVWVVNWVRDRWALKSREGRVQVDEICSTIRFDDKVCC